MSSLISHLLKQPENALCADCQRRAPSWASSNLGVFICIECSGIHRSLGSHISFVRSCTLDTWTREQAEHMAAVGNSAANAYWEAELPPDFVRPDPSDGFAMSNFIRQKYVQRKWVRATADRAETERMQQSTAAGEKSAPREADRAETERTATGEKSAQREAAALDDIFSDSKQSHQRVAKKPAPRAPSSVSSSTRKPGQKIPERLLRKMRSRQVAGD